jgi:hypothetical protein
MKKLLVILAIGSLVSACSTTGPQTTQEKIQSKRAQAYVNNIPSWFTDVPKADDAIYAVGDAISGSASGALSTARANAFEGICQTAGGKVRSQSKVYRVDTERSSTSTSTTAIRNFCPDVDVTGATVTKTEFIQENGRVRAFVQVKLPIGESNVLARTKHRDQLERQAVGNMKEEFKELDRIAGPEKKPDVLPAPAEGKNLSERAKELPHNTISDQKVKNQVEAAIARGDAVIISQTVQ